MFEVRLIAVQLSLEVRARMWGMALPGDDLIGAEVEFSPDRALSAAQCVEGVGVDFFPRVGAVRDGR